MDDRDQPSAPQSVEDKDSDTKWPTDTGTGVAKPKKRSNSNCRIRSVFSEEQKRLLLQRFHRQHYISPQERAELSKALGLSYKQVTTWYRNQRMKMKRFQSGQNPANYWDQPNFSAVSCQTFPPVQSLTPGQVQCQALSYGQESFVHSGQGLSFGAQSSSASFQLQISQLPNGSDCYFGNYGSEAPMIPQGPSAGFTNQIPGYSTGHSSVEILPIPTFEDELQYITLPPMGAECSYPSGAGVAGSSQDVYVYQNNLYSVQSGSSPGHV